MRRAKQIETLAETIQDMLSGEYRYYGIRVDARNFAAGSTIPNSWHDPSREECLDVELDGACVFELSCYDVDTALKLAIEWRSASTASLYLVAGQQRNYGRTLTDCETQDGELLPAGTETGFAEEGACCIPGAVVIAKIQ